MKIRIDVFQGPMPLGHIESTWEQSQTWEHFWAIAHKEYPELQRIEIHINQIVEA